ncbi:hypothetical protein [Paraburkholderia sp. UCT2]|uniref:hypothetical protein n=1 Tax=Paraburkholderia sp. UCT2 TaxID=2615208 RepID=UPI0016557B59|nr:hypothetical protein [Paraburkholderia sp. UCT2]MBC8730006.1 hypothetical protein [Paraburkholderia sp. UCT2]
MNDISNLAAPTTTDLLGKFGQPVAFYPSLAKHVGGVKAAALLCQIAHWQEDADHPLGVHRTAEDIERELGLTYEEQRSARKALRKAGVLIETERRLEHRIFFRIDVVTLQTLLTSLREGRS